MSTLETIVLALIQGLTEFLPISSSAHLILPSQLFGWEDQGLAFDVAVHVGTLLAVIGYFRRDLQQILGAWLLSFKGQHSTESRLAWQIALATIPAVLIGWLASDVVEQYARSITVIATTTILFGLLLWWADYRSRTPLGNGTLASQGQPPRSEYAVTWKQTLIIGLVQAVALIPGTSRSGITMTAALFLGLSRTAAARFSFLLSIPIIVLAGSYEGMKLVKAGDAVDWSTILLGAAISFISALLCIHGFLKLLEKISLLPFVIYRIVLGLGLYLFVMM